MARIRNAGLPPVAVLKAAARAGDPVAESNIAIAYRDLGNARRALFWWKRLAQDGDGDAQVDVGYCLHYGIGTRRDVPRAQALYREAIGSLRICEWEREEAMYQLALTFAEGGCTDATRRPALELLERADRDLDYPEARSVLAQLAAGRERVIACRCRRGRDRHIAGQARCDLHRPLGRPPAPVPLAIDRLRGNCGPLAIWAVLRRFGVRIAAPRIIADCRHEPGIGVHAIWMAVAFASFGLPVRFHTEPDPNPTEKEKPGYAAALRLGVQLQPPIEPDGIGAALRHGAAVVALFDTPEGNGHYSPVALIEDGWIHLPHNDEPVLSLERFETARRAEGICRQCLVVGPSRIR